MPFKWKCVNSSYLVPKSETNDSEDSGVSGIGVQSVSNFERNTSTFKEQECSVITDSTKCDTKNGITAGELCGYSGSNETYSSMPSSQLLPVTAEQTETYIKQEPVEDTENNGTSNDSGVYVGMKCEVLYKDTDVSGFGGQSISKFERNTSIFKEQQCSEITDLTECDTKNEITAGELCGYSGSNETYSSMPSSLLLPVNAEQTETYIKQEPVEDTENNGPSNDSGLYVGVKCEVLYKDTVHNSAEKNIPVSVAQCCDNEQEYHAKLNKSIKCDKYFDTTSDLSKHMMDSLAHSSNLGKQMVVHNVGKPHSCTECDKSFRYLCHLRKHMLIHSGVKYSCTECDKSFQNLSNLRRHMVTHSGEKAHSCTECDKSFQNLSSLRRHIVTHSGEKSHMCTECDKSFGQLSNLRNHMLIHTGEKPYSCTKCDKSFQRLFNLRRHILTHSGEKPHSCTECDKSFGQLCHLRRHMLIHSDEKPHGCTECNESTH